MVEENGRIRGQDGAIASTTAARCQLARSNDHMVQKGGHSLLVYKLGRVFVFAKYFLFARYL
jgi:hypothetical protein